MQRELLFQSPVSLSAAAPGRSALPGAHPAQAASHPSLPRRREAQGEEDAQPRSPQGARPLSQTFAPLVRFNPQISPSREQWEKGLYSLKTLSMLESISPLSSASDAGCQKSHSANTAVPFPPRGFSHRAAPSTLSRWHELLHPRAR